MTTSEVNYAGFWKRWAAYTLDGVLISFFLNSIYYQIQFRFFYNADDFMQVVVYSLTTLSFSWAYFAGMESSPLRATLGKMALGLFVTDEEGQRITFGRATGRFFGKIISSFILCIGFMMAGWTPLKQTLHDKMAKALVIQK